MSALDLWKSNTASPFFRSSQTMPHDLERAMRDIERLVWSHRPMSESLLDFNPVCDIDEDENEYHLTLEIPGIPKDEIEIKVMGNSVMISGEKKYESENNGKNRCSTERTYGSFLRTFTLPEGVKADNIEATYQNGVLSLAVPKMEKCKSTKIPIHEGKVGLLSKIAGKSKNKSE
jgi:HSP20 family protein